jgi:hypothetical protein
MNARVAKPKRPPFDCFLIPKQFRPDTAVAASGRSMKGLRLVQAALRRALALRATGRARFVALRRALPERLAMVRFEAARFVILRDGFAFFFAIFAISLSPSLSIFSSAQYIRIATTCRVKMCDKS